MSASSHDLVDEPLSGGRNDLEVIALGSRALVGLNAVEGGVGVLLKSGDEDRVASLIGQIECHVVGSLLSHGGSLALAPEPNVSLHPEGRVARRSGVRSTPAPATSRSGGAIPPPSRPANR